MTVTSINLFSSDLNLAKELVYDPCGFNLKNLNFHTESKDYAACSYELDGKTIEYRASKITPLKTGQFVTIWRRNKEGITMPFDSSDELHFIIISSRNNDNFGLFIFLKSELLSRGIIALNGEGGKRGLRVYPPWDRVTNKHAEKSQSWQKKYFLWIKNDGSNDLDHIKMLFI